MFKKVILIVISFIFISSILFEMPAMGSSKTEILWDNWGVPHIFAKDERSLFESFGWAQAKSHGDLLLKLYGEARGRGAEYWGIEHLALDQSIRMMGIPERAKVWYEGQSEEMRNNLEAFAKGINSYIAKHPQEISADLKQVLPITGLDVLAHVQRVIYFEFLTTPHQIEAIKNQTLTNNVSAGSNAWAIAPSKSKSGHSLLLANPHLPWSGLFRCYEAQLVAPGVDVYGSTLVGMPVPAIAFNDYLGWTLTVNNPHNYNVYELTLKPGGYLWNGKIKPFQEQAQKLKIRQSNGGYQELEWVTQKSVQGMIISQQQDHAYALRIAGLERPNVITQFWQMAKTKNLQDFEKALSSLQLPMFNILYSDIKGNIFYLHNAIAPKRKAGNWQDWQKVQQGDSDENLWTEYHAYSTLPKLTNPKTGWLQNTNDPPWTSTFPSELDPKNYPSDLAGSSLVDAENIFRTQRSLKLIKDASKLSFQDIINDKFSSRLEISDRLLPLLIPAAKMLANPLGLEAAEVLKKWDRQANPDSRGMVLFMLWVSTLDTNRVFSKPWQADKPLDTPSGLADLNTALAVLEGVAAQVKLLYGSLDVSWGEVATMQQGKYQLPASGASGKFGSFRVLNFATTADQKLKATFGDSYIAVIEFSNPIKAKTLMVYGNSSQPNSPHLGDQLSLYSKNQLRPVRRTKAEILEHLEEREMIPLNPP